MAGIKEKIGKNILFLVRPKLYETKVVLNLSEEMMWGNKRQEVFGCAASLLVLPRVITECALEEAGKRLSGKKYPPIFRKKST